MFAFKDIRVVYVPAQARRALENNGVVTLQQLAKFSEEKILQLHEMGPNSLAKLRSALETIGLSFIK
jgi:hypothetical protein